MDEEQGGNQKTRDFICSCGKNYLSYAALFTHIKQKHDGKAPGPIVRPRSERKRGRPRKNPAHDHQLRNSDSDAPKNGISIANEINNNINIFQKKAKQAAKLLGCGQFQAFQTYRPENSPFQRPKTDKQTHKRPGFKKCVSGIQKSAHKIMKEQSSSSLEAPLSLKYCRSAPIEKKEIATDHSTHHYNFVVKHLQSMFQNYEPSPEELSCHQIIQIFDWLSQQLSLNLPLKRNKANKAQKISIQDGFQMYLRQIQDSLEEFQFRQISFLLSLFYDYICHQLGKPSNDMLGVQVSGFTKYVSSFLYNYLTQKVNQLSVSSLFIFKSTNSTTALISLCNWLALQQMQESGRKGQFEEKEEQKICKQQIKQNLTLTVPEVKLSEPCQSNEQQIQFQQINDALEMAREARENILKRNAAHEKGQAEEMSSQELNEANSNQLELSEGENDDSSEYLLQKKTTKSNSKIAFVAATK